MTYDMDQMEQRLQEASLQQDKSNASYNSTMTENSKSTAKLNEANTNLAVLDQQLTDYKAYLKELQDKLSTSQRETQRQLSEESYDLSRKAADLNKELQDGVTAERAKEINKELQDIIAILLFPNGVPSPAHRPGRLQVHSRWFPFCGLGSNDILLLRPPYRFCYHIIHIFFDKRII